MPRERVVSVSRVIPAPASDIFAVIDNPAMHPVIDGSGTVRASRQPGGHLRLGDTFSMDMKVGVPYRITSKVVEYDKDRLIAWAHFGGHRWRFELEPVDGGTRVTESFDWSTSKFPPFIELMGYPKRHPAAMEKTLERLADHLAAGTA
jgi:hypothetical protein